MVMDAVPTAQLRLTIHVLMVLLYLLVFAVIIKVSTLNSLRGKRIQLKMQSHSLMAMFLRVFSLISTMDHLTSSLGLAFPIIQL